MTKKKWNEELSEYIKVKDATINEKANAWEAAIGLQDVDGLEVSDVLLECAKKNIEGNINISEVEKRIKKYYKASNKRKEKEMEESYEADLVSTRIASLLSNKSFKFSEIELINIHKTLFEGIYDHAGIIRDYDITKEEWILNNDTVIYASSNNILDTLKYDFEEERNFSYKDLTIKECIKHLCKFTSNIWQVHPFSEGNTRTVAVFIIKYLRSFGFNVNDRLYADNSWYFRNALVRSNYRNYNKNVFEDNSFLEMFFSNLIAGEKHKLKNRYLHIDYKESIDEKDNIGNEDKEGKDKQGNKSNDKIKGNKKDTIIKSKYTIEEQIIINIIRDNPKALQEDIANAIGKSLRSVKMRMSDMQNKNMIRRINGKRNGIWEIIY